LARVRFGIENGVDVALLVTGGAGFIGSNLIRHLLVRWPERHLVSLDALTYSGHLANLEGVIDHERHTFVEADITDRGVVRRVFTDYDIDGVIHLAAESHVDRAIVDPMPFVNTNVVGTVVLLEQARESWAGRDGVRFLHVSTDEVFGSLGADGYFDESSRYRPSSAYSASKAAADHFVRAWHTTFDLPVVITNSSNNYGPRQFPEKLVPTVITRALAGDPVPVYGTGGNVRDWLYVDDHCEALALVFGAGSTGATYLIGGQSELTNLDLVGLVLDELDVARGLPVGTSRPLIEFVPDRPGHDFRYAMDIGRIRSELGWSPSVDVHRGLARTVGWYLANPDWVHTVSER
jgi:dTDP-glucose 4,6-dehydratase